MRHLDAAPVKVGVRIVARFGLPHFVAAREHDIRVVQEKLLARFQFRRSELELRQFIHAVVNDRFRVHLCR